MFLSFRTRQVWANSVDPDQTAPRGVYNVCPDVSVLIGHSFPIGTSISLVSKFLGVLRYLKLYKFSLTEVFFLINCRQKFVFWDLKLPQGFGSFYTAALLWYWFFSKIIPISWLHASSVAKKSDKWQCPYIGKSGQRLPCFLESVGEKRGIFFHYQRFS